LRHYSKHLIQMKVDLEIGHSHDFGQPDPGNSVSLLCVRSPFSSSQPPKSRHLDKATNNNYTIQDKTNPIQAKKSQLMHELFQKPTRLNARPAQPKLQTENIIPESPSFDLSLPSQRSCFCFCDPFTVHPAISHQVRLVPLTSHTKLSTLLCISTIRRVVAI